jgi:hypothetical protein
MFNQCLSIVFSDQYDTINYIIFILISLGNIILLYMFSHCLLIFFPISMTQYMTLYSFIHYTHYCMLWPVITATIG